MSWCNEIRWETPAGETLLAFIAALPRERDFRITLFGSAPLQLGLDPGFLSADVDLFADDATELIEEVIQGAGLTKDRRAVYIQCAVEGNFRTSPRWRDRTATFQRHRCTIVLPHPIDILIAKLHRCEAKDLRAFQLVMERTGHPTEAEMRQELQAAVDLYRPNFDEEAGSDITGGTRVMWNQIFGHDIDVRREIIAPALAARRKGFSADVPGADYKTEMRRLGREEGK
jgi:hypothetical protein